MRGDYEFRSSTTEPSFTSLTEKSTSRYPLNLNVEETQKMNKGNTISVVLCTYNGDNYLQEQLDSIANQSHLPDELIICDDKSSDNTYIIIEQFYSSAPFPVRYYKNDINIGSTSNFERAISLAKGDIIALSDQDDIWDRDKLKLIGEIFNSSEHIGAVFSNGNIVDESLHFLGYTLWDTFRFGRKHKNQFLKAGAFTVLLSQNVVTGATLAFRSSLRKIILPIPKLWIHDAWMALLFSIFTKIIFIDKTLIDYRQHKNQQVGGLKNFMDESKTIVCYDIQIRQTQFLIDRLTTLNITDKEYYIAELNNKIKHIMARNNIYNGNLIEKYVLAIKEVANLKYYKYSNGWLSLFKDLFNKIARKYYIE